MTAREMQKAFEQRLALINPELVNNQKVDSDTIFSFLYSYTLRFVQQIYLKSAAEQNDKIAEFGKDSLYNLLSVCKMETLPAPAIAEPNQYFFDLPSDFFIYVRSNSGVQISYDYDGELRRVPNETVDEVDLNKVITSAWNDVILPHPYVSINVGNTLTVTDPRFVVIADKYTTVHDVQLTYYRKPKMFNVIGVDNNNVLGYCELPESTHMSIVEGAVDMFITENKYRLSSTSNKDKQ